ncbi:LysR family transcriptional regulator [Antrihabitans cavernicola]|uniref:LysR family transcriptional regulator n=2 Tax=Antrihabitans cavernicola TaxID=2495913 RepID=A0A5A7SIG9_9NOCA|nr:LysR family transcriptional regulator [Spelaeibacter cavernicola]
MNAAAAMVGITQQAASMRIRAMEAQVGVALLARSPQGSRLTSAGLLVAQWAGTVLAAAERLDAGIASLRNDTAAHLHVASSVTVAEHLVPRWLVALRAQQRSFGEPETEVELTAANSDVVMRTVADGDADIGFIESPKVAPALHSRVVAQDRLVVVVSPNHPWARRKRPLHAGDLAETAFVTRESGSGTRQALERALLDSLPGGTVLAPPVMELASAAAVRAAIAAGAAPGAMSDLAVADDLALGRLVAVPVADLDLTRKLRAVWRDGSQPPAGPARSLVALAARPIR